MKTGQCHVVIRETVDESTDHEGLWSTDCTVHGELGSHLIDREDAQDIGDAHMFGTPDVEYVPEDEHLELDCDRCGKTVMEGYQTSENAADFWCSKKCMAADGHDTTDAYSTASELGDDDDE